MEKQILIKLNRLLELTEKFSLTLSQLKEKIDPQSKNNTPQISGSHFNLVSFNSITTHIDGREIYIDADGIVKAKDKKELTLSEKIRSEAEIKAKIADEYDEFLKLKNDLKEYFLSYNKVLD